MLLLFCLRIGTFPHRYFKCLHLLSVNLRLQCFCPVSFPISWSLQRLIRHVLSSKHTPSKADRRQKKPDHSCRKHTAYLSNPICPDRLFSSDLQRCKLFLQRPASLFRLIQSQDVYQKRTHFSPKALKS